VQVQVTAMRMQAIMMRDCLLQCTVAQPVTRQWLHVLTIEETRLLQLHLGHQMSVLHLQSAPELQADSALHSVWRARFSVPRLCLAESAEPHFQELL
jgi:hypothetical protein